MPDDNSNNQSPQSPAPVDPVFPYTSSDQSATDPGSPASTSTPADDTGNLNQFTQPDNNYSETPDSATSDRAVEPAGLGSLPSNPPSDPGSVVVSSQTPEKYGGKKVIATIFGVLLLITAVGVGVYLVRQSVEYRNRAASGSECDQHPDCILRDEPGNSGSYTAPRNISHLFITAKEYHRFDAQNTDNGCYSVVINGQSLDWQRYGSGPNCKDVSNIQIWLGEAPPPPPPAVSAQCHGVVAYNTAWNMLSPEELADLKAGDILRLAVGGNTSSGFFDKARFTINGETLPETTNKKPGTEEFYIEYTIPEVVINFNVNAQIHHSSLGWF